MTDTLTPEFDQPQPPVTAGSYSAVKLFEKCPYATYLQKVAKEPGPPRDENHPLNRGTRIHKEAENFVTGELADLPGSLKKFEEDFLELRSWYQDGSVEIEQEWAFDSTMAICEWRDPFVWLRAKCDVVIHHDEHSATIIDYKTGKRFGNEVPHTQQGQLFAICAFHRYPQLEHVNVEFWYLDENKNASNPTEKSYDRKDITRFFNSWIDRILKLTTATEFRPKATRYACQFCDYGKNRGTGACGYAVA